ncbi:hypothetical protein ACVBGC_26775 [Burkholderia stagnalis]
MLTSFPRVVDRTAIEPAALPPATAAVPVRATASWFPSALVIAMNAMTRRKAGPLS